MTPEDFLRQIQKQVSPAYLFIGPDGWQREKCRKALIERVLTPEQRQDGLTRHDLDETEISTVIDDACSLSLFARERVIWVSSAEAALPRARGSGVEGAGEESAGKNSAGGSVLADYLKNPSPRVVIVFSSSRHEFEGDDKARLQRVQKFYSGITSQVEFPRYTPQAARKLAHELAREAGLKIGGGELDLLVEASGADAMRIATEMEKLHLYAGLERKVTEEDIRQLAPNARASNIFALVAALGRNDRAASLHSLDTLVREGEYLPLALTFLATQFRLALVVKEAGMISAGQIQAHFSKQGVPMWRSRAEQVQQTVSAFSLPQLRGAIVKIHEADKALRDARPDDRTVVEKFVLSLT
ncbi:MAG: DNA polymerase III subunit delta [Bryobacteraceae bacterium]